MSQSDQLYWLYKWGCVFLQANRTGMKYNLWWHRCLDDVYCVHSTTPPGLFISFSVWSFLTSHSGTVWEKIGVPMSKLFKLLCFGGAIIVVWYLRRVLSWTKLSEAAEEFAQKSQLDRCFPEILKQKNCQRRIKVGWILLFPLTPIDRGFIRFFHEGVGVELSPPVDFCSSNPRKYLGPSDQLP